MTSDSSKRTLYRWRHFDLPALLGYVTLSGAVLASWMVIVQPYRNDARIIARLRDSGAIVTTETDGPAWWRRIAGDEFCQRIVQVEASDRRFDDADLKVLANAPRLQMLVLGKLCNITPAGLCALQAADNLSYAMIDSHAATNDGLACLGKMQHLESLYVRGPFTDAGMAHLQELSQLDSLTLHSPYITNAGLTHLASIEELRDLQLWGRFTDEGMKHLQPLVNLEHLSCGGDPANSLFFLELPNYTEFDFIQCPLIDVAEFLQDRHGVSVRVDSEGLQDSGRDPTTPITATIANIALRDALNRVLAPHGLGWKIADGALIITTKEDADRSRVNTLELQKQLPRLKEVIVEW